MIALVFLLTAAPVAAQGGASDRIGVVTGAAHMVLGKLYVKTGGVKPQRTGKPRAHSRSTKPHRRHRAHRKIWRQYRRYPFYYGYIYSDRNERRPTRYTAPSPPTPVRPPPEPEPEIELVPQDALGPGERYAARGHTPQGQALAPGAEVPKSMPYVAVQWRDYNLPKPPTGQIYARLAQKLYLIQPDTRLITAAIDPEEIER